MDLQPHPLTRPSADLALTAEAQRKGGRLIIDYAVAGPIEALVLAPAGWPHRTDGLWETTCFEAFLRAGDEDAYVEWNFATSTRWAAYRFATYRDDRSLPEVGAPRIVVGKTADRLTLRTEVEGPAVPLRLALTAVIEEKTGVKSYWSLRHRADKPDFHAPEGFVFPLA